MSIGVELFIHEVAAGYFFNRFHLSVIDAGYAAGSFGLLALFARAVGGIFSDRIACWMGLDGRIRLLAVLLLGEGVGLLVFSQAEVVGIAIMSMLAFGLFTHMACGALYALVPSSTGRSWAVSPVSSGRAAMWVASRRAFCCAARAAFRSASTSSDAPRSSAPWGP